MSRATIPENEPLPESIDEVNDLPWLGPTIRCITCRQQCRAGTNQCFFRMCVERFGYTKGPFGGGGEGQTAYRRETEKNVAETARRTAGLGNPDETSEVVLAARRIAAERMQRSRGERRKGLDRRTWQRIQVHTQRWKEDPVYRRD